MKTTVSKKSNRTRIALVCVAVGIVAVVAAGCTANGAAVVVPADHYAGGSIAAAINTEHEQCNQCHESLGAAFNEVTSDSSLMKTHMDAWSDYEDGISEEEAKTIVEDNVDLMEKCFSTDSNGQSCTKCHETAISEDGSIEAKNFISMTYCQTCHNDDASMLEATENWGGNEKVNLHQSHLGTISCDNCHKIHSEKETMYCDECHNWGLPDGESAEDWVTAIERYSQFR